MSTTDTPGQSTSGGPLVPEIVEQLFLRDGDPKAWTVETPAPDTERDEQLRDARALVSVLRRYPGDRQTPAVRALLVLEEEATRLDAVVTAVREAVDQHDGSEPGAEAFEEFYGTVVRAIDGGAA